MYTPAEQKALTSLFAPVVPPFTISRTAMKKVAAEKLAELREDLPYWIVLEEELADLLGAPTAH
jgi:hypothetical protein